MNSVVTTNEKVIIVPHKRNQWREKCIFTTIFNQTREVLVFKTAPFSRPEYLFLHEFINLYFVVHNMYRDKHTHERNKAG